MTPLTSTETRRSPDTNPAEMQAYAARGYLCRHLADMGDVAGVYACDQGDMVRVTVLVRDFWGDGREQVYAVISEMRRRLPLPDVDIVTLAADAVGQDFEQDADLEKWL